MSDKMRKSIKLFKIFFKLGLFAFGGGYSIIPLIENEVVEKEKIVNKEVFMDIIAVVQGLPGAIGLNTSIFIGYMVNKFIGVLFCSLGSILPSVLLISGVMILFTEASDNIIVQQAFYGIRPVVVALIGYASIKIGSSAYKYKWYLIFTFIGFYLALEKIIEIPVIVIGGLILGILSNALEIKYKKIFIKKDLKVSLKPSEANIISNNEGGIEEWKS